MQLSGQITAQEAQPVHASGVAIRATGYPLLFTSVDSASTSHGHAETQTPHPLHRSLSTTIVPLITAITPFYLSCLQIYVKFRRFADRLRQIFRPGRRTKSKGALSAATELPVSERFGALFTERIGTVLVFALRTPLAEPDEEENSPHEENDASDQHEGEESPRGCAHGLPLHGGDHEG